MTHESERRFQGTMSEGYRLIRQAIPNFDELQDLVATAVAGYHRPLSTRPVRILDLGCGDGVTSAAILTRRPDASVVALDSETDMVRQARDNLAQPIGEGRCEVVLGDALAYLRAQADPEFDVVASALALHNLNRDYRHAVYREIFRVLKPGGLFTLADKIAQDDAQRFEWLQTAVSRFFDILVPLGKMDLLRACVLHEIADESPQRIIREGEITRELAAIGFGPVAIHGRHHIAALLFAHKPKDDFNPPKPSARPESQNPS